MALGAMLLFSRRPCSTVLALRADLDDAKVVVAPVRKVVGRCHLVDGGASRCHEVEHSFRAVMPCSMSVSLISVLLHHLLLLKSLRNKAGADHSRSRSEVL